MSHADASLLPSWLMLRYRRLSRLAVFLLVISILRRVTSFDDDYLR